MAKDEDFRMLKVQTCTLKVSIHCAGCKNEVKKLLKRIEGVYETSIDAEEQKVTVTGTVDSAILIKKILRAGRHAQLCSTPANNNTNQNQKQSNPNPNPNSNNNNNPQNNNNNPQINNNSNKKKKKKSKKPQGTETPQKPADPIPDEEDEEEDVDIEEEEEEIQSMQQEAVPNANANTNQNNGGIDPKVMAQVSAALKQKNPQMGGGGGGAGVNIGEMKRNGKNIMVGPSTILGGNPIGGGYQVAQPNNGGPYFAGYPNVMGAGTSAAGGGGGGAIQVPAAASMVMNGNPRGVQQMYQMGPAVIPSTTAYYNCDYYYYTNSLPYSQSQPTSYSGYGVGVGGDHYYDNATRNEEESSASESVCSVM